MTPVQAAKAHCANYQPDGFCLGIYYKDDLSVDHSKHRPYAKCNHPSSRSIAQIAGNGAIRPPTP